MKWYQGLGLSMAIVATPLAVIGYTQSYVGNVGTVLNDWAHHPRDTHNIDRMTLGCRSPRGRATTIYHHQQQKTKTGCRKNLHELHEIEEFRFGAGAGLALLVIGGLASRRRK